MGGVLASFGWPFREDPRETKFREADTDGDDTISADELLAIYLAKTGKPPPTSAIAEFLDRDLNGDMHLSRSEFLAKRRC